MNRFLSAASIFLAAFLLFQIQPIMARFALPWYGGSAAVWGACILFFQALLFVGYLYAHLLRTRATPRLQSVIHIALLVLSVALLGVAPEDAWKPVAGDDPMLGILGMLTACVGLPYFLLSSTSPLAQAWLLRESPRSLPYRFYALSNAASLGGLLAYPLVVERFWTLQEQARLWSAGYVAYVLLCALLAWKAGGLPEPSRVEEERGGADEAGPGVALRWVMLAALPSALSLAVTNHLTQNVAPIPLLWIVPLAIYLLTLILCFEGDAWYRRSVFLPCNMLALAMAGMLLVRPDLHTDLTLQLPAFSVVLFTVCMTLHGELVRRRPSGEGLTAFYLWMSLGGAIGGLSVGFGAPYFLRGYYELPLALCACGVGILMLEFRRSLVVDAAFGVLVVWLCASSAAFVLSTESDARISDRNFYGGLRVIDHPETPLVRAHRDMVHGAIVHGSQFTEEARRTEPTAYYARGTGADYALENFRRPGGRIGVIGLGTGAMAAYGRTGETYRYYELNPMVIELARSEFTFLGDSAATVETVLGDGRLSLEHEAPQGFTVLAVDAFSGDSIPMHLLSREAFALYFRHLLPDGVLAVHVSNVVLDLKPVVAAAAEEAGLVAVEIAAQPDRSKLRGASTWMLVARSEDFASRPALHAVGTSYAAPRDFRVWTDGYSNLLAVMR